MPGMDEHLIQSVEELLEALDEESDLQLEMPEDQIQEHTQRYYRALQNLRTDLREYRAFFPRRK